MGKKFFILLLLVFLPSFATAFSPVEEGYIFSFPKDHGSHPQFKTEWWYFTGHFKGEEGKIYGFQWTVFRTALQEKEKGKDCKWCSNQIYLGHAALSDLQEKKFYYDQSVSRELPGLAQSSQEKFQLSLPRYKASSNLKEWNIQNKNAQFSYDLQMIVPESVLLHGKQGYAPKSSEAGKASYYYSIPHLPMSGTLEFKGKKIKVQGEAWMDHEFASSALSENQKGWDWFGLPLGEKSALMLYSLRGKNGTSDFIFGSLLKEDGSVQSLSSTDVSLSSAKLWTSPLSKNSYPQQWQIEIPSQQLKLKIQSSFEDQELNTQESTRVIYWEGSVTVKGTWASDIIDSLGYLEMTGYDESLKSKL